MRTQPRAAVRPPGDAPERPTQPRRVARFKRLVVGPPLPTERLIHERLGKPTALAVFASDNLSSSAYATEEILRILLLGGFGAGAGLGLAAFGKVVPITIALLIVLGVLLFSYRQTIRAYPQAGGAYLVTRDNFGVKPAQVAGVALLTDYILTVSVSVAAGTAALTSIYEGLHPYRVAISVGFVLLLAWGNLRGVREAGRMFAIPTYFFLVMMLVLLGVSFFRLSNGTLPEDASLFDVPPVRDLTTFSFVFLLLRAFASGGAAVTGVEAISNGVPAFRPPEWRNAITVLMWMGSLLGGMFLGLSILAAHMHVVPDPDEKITVIAQIAKAAFGPGGLGPALFVMLQVGTMLILVLAANTSFADFPRLASFHAGDHFLPRQLTRYGDRLVFSNGILALSALSCLLLVIFSASVTKLIPLYAIGVFTSFTFSQAGMAKRHRTRREPGWRRGVVINGFGAIVSAAMTLIIAATKFSQGAYIILIAVPVMLLGLLKVNKHYEEAAAALRAPERRGPVRDLPRQRIVIPVEEPGAEDAYAVAYGLRLFPKDLRLVHFARAGASVDQVLEGWGHLGQPVELRLRMRPIAAELTKLVQELHGVAEPDELINVVIPETVRLSRWRHVLHTWHVQRLKAALVSEANVVVTNVARHEGYEALEPLDRSGGQERPSIAGWRHVAVVLVSDVHNATARSLRYALSLRADEVRCVHVRIDEAASAAVREAWDRWDPGVSLETIDSPYRQVARPIHEWVRAILDEHPRTFVTIVIPEFVVRRWWHRALHNQTALSLKGTFLFEPSVVVSAVPYRL